MLELKERACTVRSSFLNQKAINKNFSRKKRFQDSATPFQSLNPNGLKCFNASPPDLGALGASGGFLGHSLALLNGGALGEEEKRSSCSFSTEGGRPL